MDILAALKAEESKLQQQLAIVHTAMKLVNKERKSSDGKKKGMPASALLAGMFCGPSAEFLWYYNHQRPHLSLHGLTPVERRQAYFQQAQL